MLFPPRSVSVSDVASWRGSGLQARPQPRNDHHTETSMFAQTNCADPALSNARSSRQPSIVAASHTAALRMAAPAADPARRYSSAPLPARSFALSPRWLSAMLAAVRGGSEFASPSAPHAFDATLTPFQTVSWSTTPAMSDTCAPTGDRSISRREVFQRARSFPAWFRLCCSLVKK